MPEWPEMEHYRRMLNRALAGQLITEVEVQREKSLNVPVDKFKLRTVGAQIREVRRRAKMLLFDLDHGDTLLLHLMLGGWMRLGGAADRPERTIQVMLRFGKRYLYFIGLRLGYLHLHRPGELEGRLAELGPEPFDPALTEIGFRELMRRYRRSLKVLLTDQSVIAGIGNCYSDEICYTARVLPARAGFAS